jgi:hypothetical protein
MVLTHTTLVVRERARAVLDIFVCISQSPEGRLENSPGLEAWESSIEIRPRKEHGGVRY